MARKVSVEFVSDLSGSSGDDVATVGFGLDGVGYEIDLNGVEATKLRELLEPYVEAGRKVGRNGKVLTNKRVGPDPKAVRAWAEANGIKVPSRGRIPGDVVEQFEAAEG
jgi:hypothetical protein